VAPEALTVAVYVTACPTLDGLAGDELTATLEPIALTVSVRVGLTDALKSPLPRYTATIECAPEVVNAGATHVATPLVVFAVREPQPAIVVPPSEKLTAPPSGTGATVAVYVTEAPTAAGFPDAESAVAVPAAFTLSVNTAEVEAG
jgi:hypothetical protein